MSLYTDNIYVFMNVPWKYTLVQNKNKILKRIPKKNDQQISDYIGNSLKLKLYEFLHVYFILSISSFNVFCKHMLCLTL